MGLQGSPTTGRSRGSNGQIAVGLWPRLLPTTVIAHCRVQCLQVHRCVLALSLPERPGVPSSGLYRVRRAYRPAVTPSPGALPLAPFGLPGPAVFGPEVDKRTKRNKSVLGGGGAGLFRSRTLRIPEGTGPFRSWTQGCSSRKGALDVAQRRLGRRLGEVAEAVGGGYCRLQMPLSLALAVRGTVAGRRLDALEVGGGGGVLPPFQCMLDPIAKGKGEG